MRVVEDLGSRPVKVAVIGAGLLGSRHARFWSEHPATQLVAVNDIDPERARLVAEKIGASGHREPRVYQDLAAMFRDEELDAVSVATPDFAHLEPCLAALAAGVHILVEKPLAMTLRDAQAIVAAASRAGRHVMVNHSMRWIPRHREVLAALRGEIGPMVLAHSAKSDAIHVPTSLLSWAAKSSPAWFLTAHDLDLVRWFADDRVVRVWAQGTRRVLRARGIDTWDAIQASVAFAGGAIATFEASWIHPDTYPALTDDYMHVVGERGVAYLDRGREAVEIFGPSRVRHPKHSTVYEVGGRIHGSFRHALEHFIECIRDATEPETSARRIMGVVATLEAIHRSLEGGMPEAVEDGGPS